MKAIVKTTKKHLNTITKNHCLTKKYCTHYLTDIESTIAFEAIAPNHCLIGTANANLLICPVQKPGDIANKQSWKVTQVALMSFWQRRVREYLPIITSRKKWDTTIHSYVAGDLVSISDKIIP